MLVGCPRLKPALGQFITRRYNARLHIHPQTVNCHKLFMAIFHLGHFSPSPFWENDLQTVMKQGTDINFLGINCPIVRHPDFRPPYLHFLDELSIPNQNKKIMFL